LIPVNGKVLRALSVKFHVMQIPCHNGELSGPSLLIREEVHPRDGQEERSTEE